MGRFLGYGRQRVDEDDIAAVVAVLRSDLLTQGPVVERFEAALAERVGASYAVAVNSGTAALHIACIAAGVDASASGVTSALTFIASANAVRYCGGRADMLDVAAETGIVDGSTFAAHLDVTPDCRVLIPVDYAGLAWDGSALEGRLDGRLVIEDASHALGGTYRDGSPVGCGRHADMTVFSFHPVKPITTGEGGAVTTNDAELARLLRRARNHGIEREPARFVSIDPTSATKSPWYYEQQSLGYNYRLSEIQAALGASQLGKLDRYVDRRREIALRYDESFGRLPHVQLFQATGDERARSSHHLYVLRFDFDALGTSRADVMARLASRGVGSQVHYVPLYAQPFHASEHLPPSAFPGTEALYRSMLSLPLHPDLTDEEVERVVAAVTEVVTGD